MTTKIFEGMPQEPKSRWRCCTVLIQPPIHRFPAVLLFGSYNGSNIFSLRSQTGHGVIHIAKLQAPVVIALVAHWCSLFVSLDSAADWRKERKELDLGRPQSILQGFRTC
jgi:hypothetical protein